MKTNASNDTVNLVSFVLIALTGMILILHLFQNSYAQVTSLTSPSIKNFRIETQIKKSVIGRGDTQIIQLAVVDQQTRQPIGGANTHVTVIYPAGTPVREFSASTDSSGRSSFSWNIEANAPVGSYTARFDVTQQGYVEEGFYTNFSVFTHNVDSPHHHHHN